MYAAAPCAPELGERQVAGGLDGALQRAGPYADGDRILLPVLHQRGPPAAPEVSGAAGAVWVPVQRVVRVGGWVGGWAARCPGGAAACARRGAGRGGARWGRGRAAAGRCGRAGVCRASARGLALGTRDIRMSGSRLAYCSPLVLRLLSPPMRASWLYWLSPWRVSQILRAFVRPLLHTCGGGVGRWQGARQGVRLHRWPAAQALRRPPGPPAPGCCPDTGLDCQPDPQSWRGGPRTLQGVPWHIVPTTRPAAGAGEQERECTPV